MKSFAEGTKEIVSADEALLDSVFELIMNFNMMANDKVEATKFYNLTINFLTTVVYPAKKKFNKEVVLQMPKLCNAMYMWMSDFVISRQDMMIDDNQVIGDLSILFVNILKFYRKAFDSSIASPEDDAEVEIQNDYIKSLTEFIMFTSNDVVSTRCKFLYK